MKKAKGSKHKAKKPSEIDLEIGSRIRQQRLAMNVSQESLGEALDLSFQQIQKYEKGLNRVTGHRLQQIAAVLDVPITHFLDAAPVPREVESLLLQDNATSLRLLRAYNRIKNQATQRQFVFLIEQIAASQPD